jgi:Ca-activated chloride channel family protein
MRFRDIVVLILAFALLRAPTFAQSVRSVVREGNKNYAAEKFTDAEVNYRKALEKERELLEGHFNLGNALYKQGKYEEARREYEQALMKAHETDQKSGALYNIGNAQMQTQQYADAVKSYIEALKLNPSDVDAKHNLSYALARLRGQQQKQQQQNRNDQQDQKKQDQQNRDKQEQEKQHQEQQRQHERQQQDRADQQKQQQHQAQQKKPMSQAEAERILDVLKQHEKDVQKKLRARQGVRVQVEKDW